MSSLSIRFSRAIERGRHRKPVPVTRDGLLAALLAKRAQAYNHGATELELLLRAQILWSLPTYWLGEPEQRDAA